MQRCFKMLAGYLFFWAASPVAGVCWGVACLAATTLTACIEDSTSVGEPVSEPDSDSASEEESDDIVRILPLGDSITQGNTNLQSYRYPLWKKLVDAGWRFDFVGTMQEANKISPEWPDYQGYVFDKDHEGHSGYTVRELNEELEEWLSHYSFDIVLLHIGTNDLSGDTYSVPRSISRLRETVDMLLDENPRAIIFLAEIIPISDERRALRVPEFNDALEGAFRNAENVQIVDMYTDFDVNNYLSDYVHPNELGEAFLADQWFSALRDISELNW